MKTRGFRKPSIKDVASRAGVSTTTVSYFVNGNTNVCAADTADRIRAAISELRYTPNSLSRGLVRGATNTLGVCLYSPLDPEVRFGAQFFERIWRGIVRETDKANYSLLHYPLSVRVGKDTDAFLDGRVDGIVFNGGDGDTRAEEVARQGMPVVLLAKSLGLPEGCGAAYADERQATLLALEHLHGLGHRRIAHLAGPIYPEQGITTIRPRSEAAVLRLETYTEQQKARGDFDPALVGYAHSWLDDKGTIAATVAQWHALPEPPTAVFCANDALAVAVLNAATALGWSVPQELSVVGIDNSVEARTATVPITSVNVPVEEIGAASIRALLCLMEGAPMTSCRISIPVTELIIRDSVAPRA